MLSPEQIKDTFNSFNKLNVLIIGDVMVDTYLWGKVDRISPEAPVPIVAVQKKESRLGGAANVALNIQALGANPILCSVIGDDINGELFTGLLQKQNLSSDCIIKSSSRVTTVKTRVIGHTYQMLRVDEEIDHELNKDEVQKVLQCVKSLLDQKKIDVIIFEDYDKGALTEEIICGIIEEAGKRNIPTTVDPKKRNFRCYKNVTLLKPNLKELREGLKLEIDPKNPASLVEAVELLRKDHNIEMALITLSEMGVLVSTREQNEIIPAHVRNIADVSGAGDTVISVASLCLALGLPAHYVASLANLAGGLVCEKVGVVPVDKDQLMAEAMFVRNQRTGI